MGDGLHSMTGFGRASNSWEGVELRVEVRTLNGRYLDVKVRTPRELAHLEPLIRRRVQAALSRGRVDLAVDLELNSSGQVQLNPDMAHAFAEAAGRLREMGFAGELEVSAALQLPGVLQPTRIDAESDGLRDALLGAVDEALGRLLEVRREEGRALREDMSGRLRSLEGLVDEIEGLSGQFQPHWSERLRRKAAELSAAAVDETRLAQEILFYAERADVSEEIARLRTHLLRFAELLASPPEDGVGKNLDFLCQEMNREMNTVVSKSPLADASALAVEGKLEIEKIREQVQNVE